MISTPSLQYSGREKGREEEKDERQRHISFQSLYCTSLYNIFFQMKL